MNNSAAHNQNSNLESRPRAKQSETRTSGRSTPKRAAAPTSTNIRTSIRQTKAAQAKVRHVKDDKIVWAPEIPEHDNDMKERRKMLKRQQMKQKNQSLISGLLAQNVLETVKKAHLLPEYRTNARELTS